MGRTSKKKRCRTWGCRNPHLALGFCLKHYGEARRRAKGVTERGKPKPHLLEFRCPDELFQRLLLDVPDGDRSEVMRRGLEAELKRMARKRA